MSATKHETSGGAPYYVPPEPKRWPAIGLAVGVHALLLAFLVIGINWQNHEPVAVEAEVWDVNTQEAAPTAPPPQPAPEPQPETPPPQPLPKEAPPPPPVEQPLPAKQPDIALEREKKRKEELKQKKLEEERERQEQIAEQKRADEEKAKAAKALAEQKAQEQAQAKKEAEQKAEELAKQEAAKQEAEKKKKAEKLAKEKAQKAEEAKLAKARDAEMKRLLAAADNVGTGGSGTAAKSSAPRRDNGYIAAITAKVKGNTHYGGDLDQPGNPVVVFHVEQLPTGDILSVKMTKSSGIAAFDDAVKRAIENSSPLPKKKDGTVERSLEINFHMKDMQ